MSSIKFFTVLFKTEKKANGMTSLVSYTNQSYRGKFLSRETKFSGEFELPQFELTELK